MKKILTIATSVVVALIAAAGTFKEFPWNKHDLEFREQGYRDGALTLQVLQTHEDCTLELTLDMDAVAPLTFSASLGPAALDVQPSPWNGNRRTTVRVRNIAGQENGPAWRWPSFSDLVVRLNGDASRVAVSDWVLRCREGTDTKIKAFHRALTLWFSFGLSIIATVLAVIGSWMSSRDKEVAARYGHDPLQALVNDVYLPDLDEPGLSLLKDVIKMTMRDVPLEDMRSLISKIGNGSFSRGVAHLRIGLAQVRDHVRNISRSAQRAVDQSGKVKISEAPPKADTDKPETGN
jgi:hypothetical protein